MMGRLSTFVRSEHGATAAEFSLVALAAIVATIGVIDAGRFSWEINSAKAATRAGARYAVVSPMVSSTYANFDGLTATCAGGQTCYAGQNVPEGAIGPDTCTSTSCSSGGRNAAAFTAIVTEMQRYYARLQPANVVVEYRHVGIGVAGNPYAPDAEPLVTVRIQNMTFMPGSLQIFGASPLTLPSMATTLSGEDLG